MMNLSESDILALEDFWSGRLNPAEQIAIEKRLENDATFRLAATEWRSLMTEGLLPPREEVLEAAQIKARLLGYAASAEEPTKQDIAPTLPTSKGNLFVRRIYIGLSAAAAVLLLFVFTPLKEVFNKKDPYANFFVHLPRDNANLSTTAQTGKQAYDEKKYANAYPALLAEVQAGADSLNLIYASVAAIGSHQAEKAIPLLTPLVDAENWQLYRGEIQWYLALAYLQVEETTKAKELLQLIIQANEAYAQEAKDLIEQVK